MGDSLEILKQFELLPKACVGKEITIRFLKESCCGTTVGDAQSYCEAFRLEVGNTIYARECEVIRPEINKKYDIFAVGDIAVNLLNIPDKTEVEAKVKPIFGKKIVPEYKNEKNGFLDTKEPVQALLITELIEPDLQKQVTYRVDVNWDAEASVWVATSEDVRGLATEAESMESLTNKLRTLIPELLKANGSLVEDQLNEVSLEIISHRLELVNVGS